MAQPALVAYATIYGSTREIAERLAARLRERGIATDCRPVAAVDDVSMYEGVIVGSGVYHGSWIPAAAQFVQRQEQALSARHVWFFSVAAFGDRHRLLGALMKKEPREMPALERIVHPRQYRVFAGVIERHRWSMTGGLMLRLFGGHFGDNRDWNDIDQWADQIARALHRDAARRKAMNAPV